VDGSAFAGTSTTTFTDDTVFSDSTWTDDVWVCSVTPDDGDDDRRSDILLGAYRADDVAIESGAFYAYLGSDIGGLGTFSTANASHTILGERTEDRLGRYRTLAAVADFDLDEVEDLVVSASNDDTATSRAGRTGLF